MGRGIKTPPHLNDVSTLPCEICVLKIANPVWQYFEHDNGRNKTKCKVVKSGKLCGQELTDKNTTNLKNHLRSHHKEEHAAMMAEEQRLSKPKDEHRTAQQKLPVKVCILIVV